jgi:hypothetical protein
VKGLQGEDNDAAASPSTSLLVTKRTGVPGRNQRGRSYWPGLLFDSQVANDGSLSAGVLTTYQPIMDELLNVYSVASGFGGMAIFPVDGSESSTVTSYTVQSVAATQRRRLRR